MRMFCWNITYSHIIYENLSKFEPVAEHTLYNDAFRCNCGMFQGHNLVQENHQIAVRSCNNGVGQMSVFLLL